MTAIVYEAGFSLRLTEMTGGRGPNTSFVWSSATFRWSLRPLSPKSVGRHDKCNSGVF